jgi:hypothetical protein
VSGDFAELLAHGGAVAGGGAAFGGVLGFIAGSIVHDVNPKLDPDAWARKGALFGGVAGLVALLEGGVDWRA